MVELHSWLSHQHPGLKTYVALQKKTNELVQSDADHRAVYKLLSSILDPFIASFDEEPLPAARRGNHVSAIARGRARCGQFDLACS